MVTPRASDLGPEKVPPASGPGQDAVRAPHGYPSAVSDASSIPHARDLPVTGMHCAGCASSIEKILGRLEGVETAAVNFAVEQAHVTGPAPLDAIDAALARGGFALGTRETTLTGLDDATCATIAALDGVRETTRRENGTLVVTHVDTPETLDRLRDLLAADADASLRDGGRPPGRPAAAGRAGLEAPLPHRRRARRHRRSSPPRPSGRSCFREALRAPRAPPRPHDPRAASASAGPSTSARCAALRSRRADMNTLVAVGTLAAFGYSTWVALRPGGLAGAHVYYETSAAIITLICLGRWLEARAKGRAGDALAASRAPRARDRPGASGPTATSEVDVSGASSSAICFA